MIKARSLPYTMLIMLPVMALGILGVAHALWSKSLFLSGTVETGFLDAVWTFVGCYDFESKPVGTTAGWIDPGDPEILYFQIDNGYPSYLGGCEVEYKNVGTIPVHVEAINFIPGGGLTNCTISQSPSTGSFTATCDQLTITWADGLCTQLHPGDFLGSSLKAHVEQAAAQSSSYAFSVQVQLNQYNESNCP